MGASPGWLFFGHLGRFLVGAFDAFDLFAGNRFGFASHSSLEFLHAARGVEDFLFAGVERMARGAQFDGNFRAGRTDFINRAAGAVYFGFCRVFGV